MLISIQTHLVYAARQPCDLLLQIEAAQDPSQTIVESRLDITPDGTSHIVSGEEGIGTRRWLRVHDQFTCHYAVKVRVDRQAIDPRSVNAKPLTALPCDVTKFLMPSRYCHPEDFLDFTAANFGALQGGPLVAAMSDWIRDNFSYDNGASTASTTATQSLAARAGVCRDYAHTLIAMARAVGIPARIVSAYAPGVTPQDFHAVVEVYLDTGWHLIDPTGMAQPDQIARIGVGRDAADVSFMTSYGWMELIKQSVDVLPLE